MRQLSSESGVDKAVAREFDRGAEDNARSPFSA
jgi:hypothetical protein